jgi:hypothetical protein
VIAQRAGIRRYQRRVLTAKRLVEAVIVHSGERDYRRACRWLAVRL